MIERTTMVGMTRWERFKFFITDSWASRGGPRYRNDAQHIALRDVSHVVPMKPGVSSSSRALDHALSNADNYAESFEQD